MDQYLGESKTEKILRELGTPLPKAHEGEEAARYFVETLSECNLKCGLCSFGSREIFQRRKGMMNLELFRKILEKIAVESPHACVSPYHHSEPMLHPDLAEMIRIIKNHGLTCAIATNLNCAHGMKEMLEAGVDSISISVSGYYQETYQKSHVNGDIEKVKENLIQLRELMNLTGLKPDVSINYHMYKDNLGDDFEQMQNFCKKLDFPFIPSWARSISIEMTLKYLREKGLSRYKGETIAWFNEIPPLTSRYLENMERIIYLPEDYINGKFRDIHGDECPMNRRDINIRWNGAVSFCCDAFDDRFMTFDYLTTPIERLYDMRSKSPMCKECLDNNYAFYSNYVDIPGIDERASERLDDSIPDNRRFFGVSDSKYEGILEFCENHKRVFIFGAGIYGHAVSEILKLKHIGFDGFLVSDNHISKYSNEDMVKALSYINDEDVDGLGIIIALSAENTSEVYDELKKTGIDLCLALQYL